MKNFKPEPDFEEFKKLILGTIEPTRLPVTDLYINDEILQQFVEEILDRTWVPRDENLDKYYQNYVLCYKQMGFDYVPLHFWIETTFTNFPKPERWISTGSMGLVRNEHEFESFPWNDIGIDDRHLGSIEKFLPEGMKIMAVGGDFQELLDVIVGTENFFFMMYDQPELLERIIQMWFGIRLKMNSELISRDSVGGFFNCADLGSKSATLIAPDYIRKHFLPTWTSYGRKAHDADKMYWFHSCGNIYKDHVIDDLINVAKIDAFHSFQDTIMPVQDFKRVYGEQIATLGGIDVDVITRLEGDDLRKHVRSVFHECAPGGRYGAGTGNSVAAYVPLKNWLLLLEEALAYRY